MRGITQSVLEDLWQMAEVLKRKRSQCETNQSELRPGQSLQGLTPLSRFNSHCTLLCEDLLSKHHTEDQAPKQEPSGDKMHTAQQLSS